MKLITDYTKNELVKLQSDDIEKIIHLHLANEGIAIPREPVEPTYESVPEKDKKLFYVSGVDGLYFEKREIAEEVAKTLKNNFSSLRSIEVNYWDTERTERVSPFKVEKYNSREPSVNDIVVQEHAVYSADLYMQIKSKIESNKKLREDYKKRKEAFDKASESAKTTVDMIWATVRDAQREQEEKDSKLATYREYLALAEGDKDTAWKFMKKAHSVTQDQEDYINANTK